MTGRRAERRARWLRATERWSSAIQLRPPRSTRDGPIAFIDLTDRQTRVDFDRLEQLGLGHCEEALFAHEIGHHIRHPHTLVRARQHTRFMRSELADLADAWALPSLAVGARSGQHDGLLNLVYDLLINTALRGWYEAEFIALYRALAGDDADPIFGFYLAVYEAWWYLPDGALVGEGTRRRLKAIDPGWRASAAACAQFIANRNDNRCLQIVRFLVALRPYFEAGVQAHPDASPEGAGGFAGELAPGDVARVMRPAPGEAEARAWRRSDGPKASGSGPAGDDTPGRGGNPGVGQGDPIRDAQAVMKGLCDATAVAMATYRRLAASAPLDVPAGMVPGELEVPGPAAEWQMGDRIESIDWFATLTRGGIAIPGYTLKRRTWLPAEPMPGDAVVPWVELYVDMSGSMPDPVRRLNHSIIAGFILVDAATSAGGRVRVVQYSHRFEAMPDFVQSPRPARAALLSYVGGGTRFPWGELRSSVERWRRVARIVRIVITDRDFNRNWERPGEPVIRDEAVMGSVAAGDLVVLLDGGGLDRSPEKEMVAAGLKVVPVQGWSTVPAVARQLARALFPDDGTA